MNQRAGKIEQEVMDLFTHLHEHPELSWEEHETTMFLKEQLEGDGWRVTTWDDCTGLVAEWGEGKPVVGLRADIDALWQEVDGEWRANHSCGHDAHMTLALGAAKLLRRSGWQPPGTVRLIFQPAEEKGTGALKMVEKGAVDDVDYLYGVHLRPIQELRAGFCAPALFHGAAQIFQGEIRGRAAHAARPHLGINVIEVAAAFVNELGRIHTDPQVPASIKMTRLLAGDKSGNIIPDRALFTLDLRAQTNEVMDRLTHQLEAIAGGLAQMYGAEFDLQPGIRVAAAEVDPGAQSLMAKSIRYVLGEQGLADAVRTSGGEDFHFYTLQRPALKATMLGLGCDLQPGLHHPEMTFDRKSLLTGIEILAQVVEETFRELEDKGGR